MQEKDEYRALEGTPFSQRAFAFCRPEASKDEKGQRYKWVIPMRYLMPRARS